MIKKLSISFVLIMLVTLSTPVALRAETAADSNQAVTTSAENPSDHLTAEEKAQKLQERITAAKEKAASRVSVAQERRLAGLCKASQTIIEKVQSNTGTFLENRQAKYTAISDKFNLLARKLAAAGADTTELNTAITEMEVKSSTNSTALNDYATSLNDLTEIDCASDPSGFKAILETARLQRQEVLSQTMSVRTYINETIKPILQGIRTSLQTTTEGEGTN